jgi:hypothetical protein
MQSIADIFDAQDREEQLLRRREAMQEQTNSSLRNLIPQAVSGVGQFVGALNQADEEQLKRLVETAKYASAGDYVSRSEQLPWEDKPVTAGQAPFEPLPAPEVPPPPPPKPPMPPLDPDVAASVGETGTPSPVKSKNIFDTSPVTPPNPEIDPTPVKPAVTAPTAPPAKTGPIFGTEYRPIKWANSADEAAKREVADILKNRQPNPILDLLSFGAASGKYNEYKMMAEKMAKANIIADRRATEKTQFDQWKALNENAINQQRAAAEIGLKNAQAAKAAKPQVLRLTGDGRKDMQAATSALRTIGRVEEKFKVLMQKGGDGLPSGIPAQKMTAFLLAAAAGTDTSSAGGAVGVNVSAGGSAGVGGASAGVSGGAGGSVAASRSAGGQLLDPKTAQEAIDAINKTEMSPAQRDFLNEAVLMAQQLGKARDGGRMSDFDLKFYLENISNWDNPEAFANSLVARKEDLLSSYNEIYTTYAPGNEDLARAFSPPSAFNTGFKWAPETFGYQSPDDFNSELSRQKQLDNQRVERMQRTFRGSTGKAADLGINRNTNINSVVGEVAGQYKEIKNRVVPKTMQDVADERKKNQNK